MFQRKGACAIPRLLKYLVIETVLADDQLMHAREKRARLRALHDAVIVSAANRDRFADSQLRQRFRRHRLIFRRILNRTGSNDH